MLKEILDRTISFLLLLLLSPLLLGVLLLVFLEDGGPPLYIAPRAGRYGRPFRMVKIRSMIVGADRIGGTSSPRDDGRITRVGAYVRRLKIDELLQFWNVLTGDMSIVGPRPQVLDEVATYSAAERHLLDVKPGITDFASIVFADEGEILEGAADVYGTYVRLIRPWKSQLGLFYVDHRTTALDLELMVLTLVRILSPKRALDCVGRLLVRLRAPEDLVDVARRQRPIDGVGCG